MSIVLVKYFFHKEIPLSFDGGVFSTSKRNGSAVIPQDFSKTSNKLLQFLFNCDIMVSTKLNLTYSNKKLTKKFKFSEKLGFFWKRKRYYHLK